MCYHYSSFESQPNRASESLDGSSPSCQRFLTASKTSQGKSRSPSGRVTRPSLLSRGRGKRRLDSTCFNCAFKTTMRTLLRALLLPSLLLNGSHFTVPRCGLSYSDARMTPHMWSSLSVLGILSQQMGDISALSRRAHSHNDYHQENPLASALRHGIKSVEVDVFPRNNELWVGHTRFELDSSRTIENMYIEPILQLMKRSLRAPSPSRGDPRVTKDSDDRPFPVSRKSLYRQREFYSNSQPQLRGNKNHLMNPEDDALTLLVDFKADAEKSMPLLHKAIEPLHPYLSKVDENGKFHKGKVTILVSGNRPKEESLVSNNETSNNKSRFIFIDGRAHDLTSATDTSLVPMVSLPWRKLQMARFMGRGESYIRGMVSRAHEQGKRLRIWGAPNRERLWHELVENNVDFLSIDDHGKFARFASRVGFYR